MSRQNKARATMLAGWMAMALSAVAGEAYVGHLNWRNPVEAQVGTRERDAVAAAYALRTAGGERRLKDGWELVRAVYGRDYAGEIPAELVVASCEATATADERGRALQRAVDELRPGDVITAVGTNGLRDTVLYVGNVYGDGQGKALAVGKTGLVFERGYGTMLFNWPMVGPLKLRGTVTFRVIRPLADPTVTVARQRAYPRGEGIETEDERLRAILAVAWARYLKGNTIQYDAINLVGPDVWKKHSDRWGRYDYHGKVELATPDRTRYTVCSSFVYETLWEAFGYGIGDEGRRGHLSYDLTDRPPPDLLVYAYDKKKNHPPAEDVLADVRRLLQPGDVISYAYVYRKRAGHVVLYVGEVDGIPTILHSTGQKYDFASGLDKTELEGTMNKDDVEATLLTPGEPRYLLKYDQFTILRPLRHKGLKLTAAGKARAKLPKFRCDRRVQGGRHGSVVSGETLTYRTELLNADRAACETVVRETLPEGTELVSTTAGCWTEGRTLAWPIRLEGGQRQSVGWTVRVTAKPGERIVAKGGQVGGLRMNWLITDVVGRRVTLTEALDWAERKLTRGAPLPECRVSGWAGGYRTAEPSRAKRIVETRSCDLTDGDVVLSVPKRGEDETCRIWAKSGDCLWERTKDGALRAVPEMEVTALLACDFFMAFRPAAEPDETARP